MDIPITAVPLAETLALFAPVQKVYTQNINKSFKLFLRGSLQTTNKLQIMFGASMTGIKNLIVDFMIILQSDKCIN